jgi:hypothetical protein
MSSELRKIADYIKNMLQDITVVRGFEITMGSVNELTEANMIFPSAIITYVKETLASEAQEAYGYATAEFKIKIKAQLSVSSTNALIEIDALYDKIIYAIKLQMSIYNGILSNSTHLCYGGFEKEKTKNGDLFTPCDLIITLKALYQFEGK